MERGFAVIGLGYVGLPVALALAKKFEPVIGFDISQRRIAALRQGHDATGEVPAAALAATRLRLTDDPEALAEASFLVVTVPTPIDGERRPDLRPLTEACALVGPRLKPGAVVVFESTVYPGLTREVCGKLLAEASGLVQGRRFQARLFAGADQSRRPASPARKHRQDRRRRGPRDLGAGRRRLWTDRRGGPSPRLLARSRRGGQGHREYPARPQHRADERAGDHLRSARHPDPRGA